MPAYLSTLKVTHVKLLQHLSSPTTKETKTIDLNQNDDLITFKKIKKKHFWKGEKCQRNKTFFLCH